MALRLLTTSSDLSTSATKWVRSEYSNFPPVRSGTAAAGDTLGTERTVNVTFANAGNQVGIVIAMVRSATTLSGNLVVKLYEGATLRTTNTFTLSTVVTWGQGYMGTAYLPLTSYAVTTAGSTWSYKISTSVASMATWVEASSAYKIACFLDQDSAAPSANDDIMIPSGVTLTFDASQTFTYLYILSNGIFAWKASPAASYTLTIVTGIVQWKDAIFRVGSSGAGAIPYAQQAIITRSTAGSLTTTNYSQYTPDIWEFYGAAPTNTNTMLAQEAAKSQKVIVTSDDMSASWVQNDVCFVAGQDADSGGADTNTYTIDSISGTSITFKTNLAEKYMKYAKVINMTRTAQTGIALQNFSNYSSSGPNYFEYIKMQGVYMTGGSFLQDSGTGPRQQIYNVYSEFSDIYAYLGNLAFVYMYINYSTWTRVFLVRSAAYWSNNGFTIFGNNNTFSNVLSTGNSGPSYGGLRLNGSGNTFTNFWVTGTYHATSSYGSVFLYGAGNTFTNLYIFNGYYSVYLNSSDNTFTNCYWQRASVANIYFDSSAANKFVNGAIGGDYYKAGCVLAYVPAGSYYQALMTNTDVGNATLTGQTGGAAASYLRFHTYDTTANDHRGYQTYGNYVSCGTGLTDTTCHTAGGYAIRFEPLSSTSNLSWSFDVPTGNIQNNTMFVGVWCKINSATYYAGTHQLPRLTITYDQSSTEYCQAAEKTDWQLLFVPITPTTTYGQITVTLSARTDATTTDSYVYWDDFMVAYPPNVSLDLGGMDLWANSLPITPPIAIPISAKTVSSAVWEELISSHTTASTFGKHVGNKLLTLAKFLGLK